MAPDRGTISPADTATEPEEERGSIHEGRATEDAVSNEETENSSLLDHRQEMHDFLAEQAHQGQNFTLRGVLVGLAIGVIICFSNTYFGLQTGWISGMAMPAALIGFGWFKSIARWIDYPFTPVENVLVQTVAGAVGTMPLGCGFVGVMPALNYLLLPEENGPLNLPIWKVIVWALGIGFFGVVFAVPLRREMIIREKLKFPTGTATALVIGVLHGNPDGAGFTKVESGLQTFRRRSQDLIRTSTNLSTTGDEAQQTQSRNPAVGSGGIGNETDHRSDWKAKIKLLLYAFAVSAVYTLATYFVPQIRDVPIFGLPLAHRWLWTLNPSPAYVGQGIIMGPATTIHMLLGAIIGWGILSPLAKSRGWAPGPVDDWTHGSRGWIVWVSLAVMLADSVVSLGWLLSRPVILHAPHYVAQMREQIGHNSLPSLFRKSSLSKGAYTVLSSPSTSSKPSQPDHEEPDAPPEHLVSTRAILILFILSIIVCVAAVHITFGALIPLPSTLLSIFLALLLSIMGVRATGETDLNPVSGISKITQLFFALITPAESPNAVTINLLAGAISEAGALQAGDMMQDLKTGHLLGAAPKAQFYGQMIGSAAGAVVSALVYKLYTTVYEVPGALFQVPTAYVWYFTARLVNGRGLPEMAWQWAVGAGAVWVVLTGVRIYAREKWWQAWVPGGIAVAVGMYNVPSFTLARAVGGIVSWYWRIYRRREDTPVIVLASGLILGEGLMSIVDLVLASLEVKHL